MPGCGRTFEEHVGVEDYIKAGERMFAGGKAQSSASPDLQYISTEALFRLADRCTLGVKNKGETRRAGTLHR